MNFSDILYDIGSSSNESTDEDNNDSDIIYSKYNMINENVFTNKLIIDTFNVPNIKLHDKDKINISFINNEISSITNEGNSESIYKTTGPDGIYRNVIGFEIDKVIIPLRNYNINSTNNVLKIVKKDWGGPESNWSTPIKTIIIEHGHYTMGTLITELNAMLDDDDDDDGILSISSPLRGEKIVISTLHDYEIDIIVSKSSLLTVLGYYNVNYPNDNTVITILQNKPYTFPGNYKIDSNYIDIIIDEVPLIACRDNSRGVPIIERVPIEEPDKSIIVYTPEKYKCNYCLPFDISHLNISLLDDNGNPYFKDELTNFSIEIILTRVRNYEDLLKNNK